MTNMYGTGTILLKIAFKKFPTEVEQCTQILSHNQKSSVADPGCLPRIPIFEFFPPGPRVKKIPDPGSGSASMSLDILTQKTVSKLSEI
jgi:hypothetical protein